MFITILILKCIICIYTLWRDLDGRIEELNTQASRQTANSAPRAVVAALTPALDEAIKAGVRQTLPQCG